MQLLVLALMLAMAGNGSNLKQIQPILESFGGEEAANAVKQAEELSDMLTAVQALAGTGGSPVGMPQGTPDGAGDCQTVSPTADCGFPLAPIANLADENIKYCLSRYIALGE